MGNKITSTRAFVDEKYTRPQGLHDPKDVDYRRLRRLILNGQLAPCFPGVEECTSELDECPICFLFYPSLNRSRCCSKGICTECYLQIKSVQFARSVQCPFCKTSNYAVEFRGAMTAEEKVFEQAEEQKVIEAKIRIRQKELRDEAEHVKRLVEDTQAESFESEGNAILMEPGMSAQAAHMQQTLPGLSRTEEFELNLENIMLMEAISLSIQEQGPMYEEFDLAHQIPAMSSTSFAGRTHHLRTIATLAETQATGAEIRGGDQVVISTQNLLESDKSLIANHNDMPSGECRDLGTRSCTINPLCRGYDGLQSEKQDVVWEKWQNGEQSWQNANCCSEELNGWIEDSKGNSFRSDRSFSEAIEAGTSFNMIEGRNCTFGLGSDRSSSEAVEAGTSFSSSIPSAPDVWEAPDFHSSQYSDNIASEASLSSALASTLPLSFEDQIMLAMALSLVDAQAQGRGH